MIKEIRRYKDSDWKYIVEIFNKAKPDELKGSVEPEDIVSLEQDAILFDSFKKSKVYIAENEKGDFLGYAGLQDSLISFLFVDPKYYGLGIGKELLKFILNKVGDRAWLFVAKTNERAIYIYKKMGFSIVEEFVGKYNGKVEVNVLRLALKPELEAWSSK